MAGAEEVVAAIERREGVEYAGPRPQRAGLGAASPPTRLDRVNVTLAATETFNQRNGNATLAEAIARVGAILAAAGGAGDRDDLVASAAPSRVAVDPGVVAELAAPLRRPRRRSSSRTRSASRRRRAVARARRAGEARPASTATTRATPATRTASRRSRPARAARRLRRRAWRLSLRAARDRQHRDRGSRLPARRRGRRDRRRPRRRSWRGRMARGRARPARSRARSTAPARPLPLRDRDPGHRRQRAGARGARSRRCGAVLCRCARAAGDVAVGRARLGGGRPQTRIGLWSPQVGIAGGRGGAHVHYALHVAEADYDGAVERLHEHDYEPHEEHFGDSGRAAYVTDPDGNVVELWTWPGPG